MTLPDTPLLRPQRQARSGDDWPAHRGKKRARRLRASRRRRYERAGVAR